MKTTIGMLLILLIIILIPKNNENVKHKEIKHVVIDSCIVIDSINHYHR